MFDERINVLTYTVDRYRKTYDVLCLLKAYGYESVHIYAKDFSYTKTFVPLYEHRPPLPLVGKSSMQIAANFHYPYHIINEYDDIQLPDESVFLVCGAGILPDSFINRYIVINAHPGYIPIVRGLDSLKWAVCQYQPIGVTSHRISSGQVDAGEVIDRRKVELKPNDSFHMVAYRQYEMEVCMLVEALDKIRDEHEWILADGYPLHRRMPKSQEQDLLEKFEEYKRRYFSESEKKFL